MALRKTALYRHHKMMGAQMISFAGWSMPLRFSTIIDEHMAVRKHAGLFDVSHMGKLVLFGKDTRRSIESLSANVMPEKFGRVKYTHILDSEGRIIDDAIVTCLGRDAYLCVCNAMTREKIKNYFLKHLAHITIVDVTEENVCLAFQGPVSSRVMQELTHYDLTSLKSFRADLIEVDMPRGVPQEMKGWGTLSKPFFARLVKASEQVAAIAEPLQEVCLLSRTGYTGEDGFEIITSNALGTVLWKALPDLGRGLGVKPAGLGARDILRLERGYLLSGQDFDGSQTPLEAGCEWLIDWDHQFIGKDALENQRRKGTYKRLVGILLNEKGVPRNGCKVYRDGNEIGRVTSGTMSPCLKRGIALAYVSPDFCEEGTEVSIEIRGRKPRGQVKKPPFV